MTRLILIYFTFSACSVVTTCENAAYAGYCGDLAGKSVTIDKRAAWLGVE